jgi:hypothetical protein
MRAFQVAADAACSSDELQTALAEPPIYADIASIPVRTLLAHPWMFRAA